MGNPRHGDKAAPKASREVVSGAERSQGSTNLGGVEGPGVPSKGEGTVSRRPNPLQNSSEGRGGPINPSGGNGGRGDLQPAGPPKENKQGGTRGGAGALQRCILCQATSRDLQGQVLDSHLPRGFYEAHPSEVVAAMMLLADALGTDFTSLRCRQMILPEAREMFKALALSSASQGAAIPPKQVGVPVTPVKPQATASSPQQMYAGAAKGGLATSSPTSTTGAGIRPTPTSSPASISGVGIKPTRVNQTKSPDTPPRVDKKEESGKERAEE